MRYGSDLNDSLEYGTSVAYRIGKKNFSILRSDITTRDKRSPEYWAQEAYADQLEKEFEKSIAAYRKPTTINPEFAEGFVNLGYVLHDVHRFKEAHEAFDRALQIKPDLCQALIGKAQLLMIEKEYKGAEKLLKRCQEEQSNSAKVQYSLACAYSLQGKKQEAIASLERAIARDQSLKTLARRDSYFNAIQGDPVFTWLTE